MLILLSPSKSQDFSITKRTERSVPIMFPNETEYLAGIMKKYSKKDLMDTMGISEKLAELNHGRFQEWTSDFAEGDVLQAIFAFRGDVYRAFFDKEYKESEFDYMEKHVRIVSGLYGLLTPLTNIKPYRLEMGLSIPVPEKGMEHKNLYSFWKDRITSKN